GGPGDFPNPGITKENRSIAGEEHGTVAHRVQKDVKRVVGAFERAGLDAPGTGDHQGVYLSGTDGLERCFSFVQPVTESPHRAPPLRDPLARYDLAGVLARRSRPTRARSVLERSPTSLRIGSGSFRTSVGSARI